MTMPTTTTTTAASMSARIAAGVTATYLLDLARHPAPAPGDGRRAARGGRPAVASRFARERNRGDCAPGREVLAA
jgi:hypothetical protein